MVLQGRVGDHSPYCRFPTFQFEVPFGAMAYRKTAMKSEIESTEWWRYRSIS